MFSVGYTPSHFIHQVQHIDAAFPFQGTRFMAADGAVMYCSSDWKENQLILPGSQEGLSELLCQLFYTHTVGKGFLQIHSSFVDYKGKGILFLGSSGVGKTTQAELWERYCGASIVNGDLMFLEKKEDGFLGWGTPWHGSSPYCINTSVPVTVAVVLRQAPENTIRLLRGFERLTAVSKNIFYPLWLEDGLSQCMETFDAFLRQIPVYELSCRPDQEAVALLKRRLDSDTVWRKRKE